MRLGFALAAALVLAAASAGAAVPPPQVVTDLVVAGPRLLVAVGERSLLASEDAGAT